MRRYMHRCTVLNPRGPLAGYGAPAALFIAVVTVRIGLDRLFFNGRRCSLDRLTGALLPCRTHFIRHGLHAFGPLSTFLMLCLGWRRLYLDLFHIHGIRRRFIRKHDFALRIR